MLSKPALPGTSMRTPGTMKTSGERRSLAPTRPPAEADGERCDEDGGRRADELRAGRVCAEGEDGRGAHHPRVTELRAQREREREAGRDGREQVPAREGGLVRGRVRQAEPARRDRAPDLDAEDEPDQLDESVRRVRDARLEVLARQLSHADRQSHARQEGHQRCKRHDAGRRVQAELHSRGCEEARGDGGDGRRDRLGSCPAVAGSATPPTMSPTTAAAAASRQPPPRTGVRAAPAIPYAASSSGQGRSSGCDLISASCLSASLVSARPAITSSTRSSRRAIASRSTAVGRTRSVNVRWCGSDPSETSTSVGVAET